jgi:hypothetical protein
MTRKFAAASLAALAILLSAGTALAATGVAKQAVNVREGAGTSYDIVGRLSAGERVEIIECDDGWCETDEGFVAASYLQIGGSSGGDDEDDEDEDDDIGGFDSEDGEFDDDPLGLEDDVPESIHGGYGDDDDD